MEEECCRELFFKSSAAATSSGMDPLTEIKNICIFSHSMFNKGLFWMQLRLYVLEIISNIFFKLSLIPPDVDLGSDLES